MLQDNADSFRGRDDLGYVVIIVAAALEMLNDNTRYSGIWEKALCRRLRFGVKVWMQLVASDVGMMVDILSAEW